MKCNLLALDEEWRRRRHQIDIYGKHSRSCLGADAKFRATVKELLNIYKVNFSQ